jgi:uncharacterized membrane protein YhaH (DUF805 family)
MERSVVAVLYFFLALLVAWMQMEFLRARDLRRAGVAATIDMVNTGLHYVPILLVVFQFNWLVIVAECLANFVASYYGVRRLK